MKAGYGGVFGIPAVIKTPKKKKDGLNNPSFSH